MKENTTYVAEIMKKCVLCRGMDDEEVRAFYEEGLAAGMLRMRRANTYVTRGQRPGRCTAWRAGA